MPQFCKIVLCSRGVKKNSEISYFECEIFLFWPQKGWNSILSEAQVETERSEVKRGQNEVHIEFHWSEAKID